MLPNGWKKVKLGDVAKVTSGGTPLRTQTEYWNGDIPWVKTAQIQNRHISLDQVDEYITEKGVEESSAKIVPKGTLLMAMYGQGKTRGQVAMLDFDASINQACAAFHLNKSCIIVDYLYQFFLFEYENIRNMSNSGGQKNLSAEIIKNITIVLPPLNEQKKIAEMLSVWDKAIEKTEKLIEAKELFFKKNLEDCIYAPAKNNQWKIEKLGNLSQMSSGGTPKSSVKEFYDGDILWASIADMTEQGMYVSHTAKTLTQLGVDNSAAKVYPKGTVLYAMYASIGEVSIAVYDMASSQAILGIQVGERLLNKYLYYFLVGQKERIKLQGQAGTQSNLNAGMVRDFDIPLPSISEQEKIVHFFDLFEKEIDVLKEQLDNYKKQKQGLMQKLLIGQWRVK